MVRAASGLAAACNSLVFRGFERLLLGNTKGHLVQANRWPRGSFVLMTWGRLAAKMCSLRASSQGAVCFGVTLVSLGGNTK
jgi:hypothetical protein